MRIENLKDLFAEQVKDLYSSEKQTEDALKEWSTRISSEDLRSVLQDHVRYAREHRERIKSIADELGVDPTGEKCEGTEGIIKEGRKFLNAAQNDEVRDAGLITMVQRLEHYGMAAYGSARTYALHLDYEEAADSLQEALDEDRELDKNLTELAERTLNPRAIAQ